MALRFLLVWALALLALPCHAEVPAQRLVTLSRGINLVSVFDNPPPSPPAMHHDLDIIHRAGLRHIRIFVRPDWVLNSMATDHRLDDVVHYAQKIGLGVILCMADDKYLTDQTSPQDAQRWLDAWDKLAKHYRKAPPDLTFFELANEPSLSNGAKWSARQNTMLQHVRAIAPDVTVLLTSSPLSMVWSYPTLAPSDDPDVVYTWHLYQPMVFTHQGADWSESEYKGIHGLVYPPDPKNVRQVMAANPLARDDLLNYETNGKNMMKEEVDAAAKWAHDNHAHMVVTEFGVLRVAPPASRAMWLGEARRRIEAAGFGWTLWEFDKGFGIKPELMRPDCEPIIQSLGLCH